MYSTLRLPPNNRLHADAAGAACDLGATLNTTSARHSSRSTTLPAAQVKRSVVPRKFNLVSFVPFLQHGSSTIQIACIGVGCHIQVLLMETTTVFIFFTFCFCISIIAAISIAVITNLVLITHTKIPPNDAGSYATVTGMLLLVFMLLASCAGSALLLDPLLL